MTRSSIHIAAVVFLCAAILPPARGYADDGENAYIEKAVAQVIQPAMKQYAVPGMAVGIVIGGRNYVYNYGVASKATGRPILSDTLFEIGSVSKTFTASLASYAQISGNLSLSDTASKYLPSLRGSSFDKVSLLNLGTHTPGGLPLQISDQIASNDQLMRYFQQWKPAYAPGTYRTYSNLGIGMLGIIAAKSMKGDFAALMEDKLFSELGMKNTYLEIPSSQIGNYAQGYTKADAPVRLSPGVLAPEAYGIRATAGDMVRFAEANMRMLDINQKLQRAIIGTHMGYYRIGAMTQDLIWEQYRYPVELKDLLAGNSAKVSGQPNLAIEIDPPLPPQDDVLMDKTGSTNGFAAYVAFIPAKKIGVVLLANKNYPIDARVTEAYDILARLENGSFSLLR